jgi:hypothetical protein
MSAEKSAHLPEKSPGESEAPPTPLELQFQRLIVGRYDPDTETCEAKEDLLPEGSPPQCFATE